MSKLSVKKPFTVLVMVVIMIVLGIVSVMRMQMDLLPEISLPYIMVITTYPGASPEKVESQICEPMESALGTITGVKNIFSVSNENYGMVQLEFVDDTDMDSAMVKISSAIDTIEDFLPEDAGTPSIMEISMDMMATQYLAVAYEGMSIEELSEFVEDKTVPMFERQDGVASVSSIGLVEKTIQVELDAKKVDSLNDKILATTDEAFAEALEQLDDAKKQLEDSQTSLNDNKQKLTDSANDLTEAQQELDDAKAEMEQGKKDLEQSKTDLANGKALYEEQKTSTEEQLAAAEIQLYTAKSQLETTKLALTASIAAMESEEANKALTNLPGQTDMSQINAGISALQTALDVVDASLAQAIPGYDKTKTIVYVTSIQAEMGSIVETENTLGAYSNNVPTGGATNLATINTIASGVSDPTNYVDKVNSLIGPTLTVTDTTSVTEAVNLLNNKYDADNSILGLLNQRNDLASQLSTAQQSAAAASQVSNMTSSISSAESEALTQARAQLAQIEQGLAQVDSGLSQLYAGNIEAAVQLANASTQITLGEMQIKTAESQLEGSDKQFEDGQKQIDDGWEQLNEGWEQIADGQDQIDDGWDQYYKSLTTYEKQKVETLRHANADQLLTLSTLAQLIYAQNFEMPAGYIDDEDDNSWLLKVGENYHSVDDLSDMVLCNIKDIGDVKLGDVATITIIDNSLDSYARLNNDKAVILSIFKSSTAGTNEVSRTCKRVIEELEEQYPGLDILVVMDQGDYITIIIKSLMQSMLLGAALAIIILALFLKDVRPTVVVALSIPLSVLTAIVALYFSGISLNMLSLSGLSLGIGMLVDNSIVVLENIYRLRGRGVEAPRASVQGANQVTGSIIASTLTTVAVFFPLVFTTGMINDLMMPMALSIIFCLLASLLVSMTLIPATCSTLLRKSAPKEHKFFDKVQNVYAVALDFCLKIKIIPLAIAIALLALSVWQVMRMGIVMIPDMTSNEMQMSLTLNEDMEKEECYDLADAVLEKVLAVDGIGSVGVMAGGEASLIAASSDREVNYHSYQYMIVMEDEDAGKNVVKQAISDIEDGIAELNLEDKGCEYSVSSSMMDASQLTGSGLSINIYGPELDELSRISEEVMDIVGKVEGFDEITNDQEDPDQVIHLTIDKNKAMSQGLSVAQIYAGITDKMNVEQSAVKVNIDGEEMDIVIVTHIDELTYENLMDYTFEVSEVDEEDGNTYTHDVTLGELATEQFEDGVETIERKNQSRYITVSASVLEGYNTTLLTREIEPDLEKYRETLPNGYTMEVGGEFDTVNTMIKDMLLVLALGGLLIYLIMVAQFQSLLSPFIVIFTVPLAFTGGLIGLWISGENLSIMGLMGFVLLLGTVVNNGIVFVDYVNQLRKGGLDRHTALIATGKTRMRPILMTALTTILAMSAMIFGDDMGSQMGKGMAIVVAGGLLYATLMTLFIIPVMYDILYKKQPLDVDLGSEDLDDVPDDAADYVASLAKE